MKHFFEFIFYSGAIFFILLNFLVLFFLDKIKRYKKKALLTSDGKKVSYTKKESGYASLSILFLLWVLFLTMTSQWIFALLLILLFAINFLFSKSSFWIVSYSLMKILILFMIIINKYHLHLTATDFYNLILKK